MTELTLDSRLVIPPQVMSRLVEDETVLLNLESGIYFGLDSVGRTIWEALSEGKDLGAVVDVVAGDYDVDKTRARDDVLAFVRELLERGLLGQ